MCFSRENIDPNDMQKFSEFVDSLGADSSLGTFLGQIRDLFANTDASICFAPISSIFGEGEEGDGIQAPPSLPPGIYPPDSTFD